MGPADVKQAALSQQPTHDAARWVRRLAYSFVVAAAALLGYDQLHALYGPDTPHVFSGVLVPPTPISRFDPVLREVGHTRLLAVMAQLIQSGELVLYGAAPPPESCTQDECRVLGLLSAQAPEALRPARERLAFALRMRLALAAGQGLPGPLQAFAEQNEALYLWARDGVYEPPGDSEVGVRARLLAREAPARHALRVLAAALLVFAVVAGVGARRARG